MAQSIAEANRIGMPSSRGEMLSYIDDLWKENPALSDTDLNARLGPSQSV
jgi:hypothetical protein